MVYPYFIFFALKKRSEMLVNKRVRGFGKLFEKIGVRYQVPKKFGFLGVLVVSLHLLSRAVYGLRDEKTKVLS